MLLKLYKAQARSDKIPANQLPLLLHLSFIVCLSFIICSTREFVGTLFAVIIYPD